MSKISKQDLKFEISNSPTTIRKAIKVIADHKLHVPGWQMMLWLECMPDSVTKIVIAKLNGKPVASGMERVPPYKGAVTVGVFVKNDFRLQGIGTHVVEKLHTENVPIVAGIGVKGSWTFYEKCAKVLNVEITVA